MERLEEQLARFVEEWETTAQAVGAYMPALATLMRIAADKLADRYPDDANGGGGLDPVTLPDKIIDFMKNDPHPRNPLFVYEGMKKLWPDTVYNSVSSTMYRMAKSGVLVRCGHGWYRLRDPVSHRT